MKVQGTVNHSISGSFLTFTIDAKFEKMGCPDLNSKVITRACGARILTP